MLPYDHVITGANKEHSELHPFMFKNSANAYLERGRDSRAPQQNTMSSSIYMTRGHRDGTSSAYERIQNNPSTASLQESTYKVKSARLNDVALPTTNELLHGAFSSAGIERQIGQQVGHPPTGSARGIATNQFNTNPKLFANNRS